MLLANATMHKQVGSDFAKYGFQISETPLLREVSGQTDAVAAAKEAVDVAVAMGANGVLIGGRSDVVIYVALMATEKGIAVYVAETKRVRDQNDRFVFKLSGVSRVALGLMVSDPAFRSELGVGVCHDFPVATGDRIPGL